MGCSVEADVPIDCGWNSAYESAAKEYNHFIGLIFFMSHHDTPRPTELTPRQEMFTRHIVCGRSLTHAARLAGYAPASARQQGSELFRRPEIQARIATLQAARESAQAAHIESAIKRLEKIEDDANRNHHFSAALRAVQMRLELVGVLFGGKISLPVWSDEEDAAPDSDPTEEAPPDLDQAGLDQADPDLPDHDKTVQNMTRIGALPAVPPPAPPVPEPRRVPNTSDAANPFSSLSPSPSATGWPDAAHRSPAKNS
jgi:hypothetical protein